MVVANPIKPFGFDRVFRYSNSEAPAISYTDLQQHIAELEALLARQQADHVEALNTASAEAFEAGRTEAQGDQAIALLSAVDALHASVEQLDAQFADTKEAIMRDAAQAAFAAAEALAGHAMDHAPLRVIDEALGRALEQLGRGAPMGIRVHSDLVADIEAIVAHRSSKERRALSLTVIGDDAMPHGDAMLFWDQGGLAVEAIARRNAVIAEFGPLLSSANINESAG